MIKVYRSVSQIIELNPFRSAFFRGCHYFVQENFTCRNSHIQHYHYCVVFRDFIINIRNNCCGKSESSSGQSINEQRDFLRNLSRLDYFREISHACRNIRKYPYINLDIRNRFKPCIAVRDNNFNLIIHLWLKRIKANRAFIQCRILRRRSNRIFLSGCTFLFNRLFKIVHVFSAMRNNFFPRMPG